MKLSALAQRLKVGPLKRLYKYNTPQSINMAGGLPMEKCFPFSQIDVKLNGGDSYTLDKGSNLVLNYHRGSGIPALADWMTSHVKQIHKPTVGHQTCMTVGSTDAWAKTLSLIDTENVLLDQYAYGAAVTTCEAHGKLPVGVAGDQHGMRPDALRRSIVEARAQGRATNLLYLVPVGQNPQGHTMPLERKQAIYDICREMDMTIVEDDAYYYLYFGSEAARSQGVKDLPKSFLSLDQDGRVIRLDSCSKFLAPGMRLGWVTAPEAFIDKYVLLQEISVNIPSSVSQSLFHGLVTHWGEQGFDANIIKIQDHYRSQCQAAVSALRKHFSPAVCQFTRPDAGMFIWLKFPTLHMSSFELFRHLAEQGVICVPGDDFLVAGVSSAEDAPAPGACLRITFAPSSPEQIEQGVEKIAATVNRLLLL